MKLADLDKESRLVIYLARVVTRSTTSDKPDAMGRLTQAIKMWELKHEKEMMENLLAFVFPDKKGKMD